MFIKYNPKYPHIKVVPLLNGNGLSVAAESVILNPGTNEISDEKWNQIKSDLAAEISAGIIVPFSVETKVSGLSKATTIKDVPVTVAAKIIAGCSNKNTLRTWFKENLSDELALLVVRRMRQLNMDIDSIAGEGEVLSDADIIDESKSDVENGGTGAKEPEKKSGYDGMSYKELQEAAKEKGIDHTQKKEVLIKALKEDSIKSESEKSESDSGDKIPDFDNPNVKVGE